MRSVKIQTYTNAINVLIKQAATKEEITKFTFGMELPEEAQENVNNIVATSMAIESESYLLVQPLIYQ